jgi:hypothetical protein
VSQSDGAIPALFLLVKTPACPGSSLVFARPDFSENGFRRVPVARDRRLRRRHSRRRANRRADFDETCGAWFGLVVSERFAASALPVLGAFGGATVNFVFMNHFQRVAHGHFTIRRLERAYGPTVVRRHYEALFSQ